MRDLLLQWHEVAHLLLAAGLVVAQVVPFSPGTDGSKLQSVHPENAASRTERFALGCWLSV
ncbi:MAG: hypothetical protein Kow0092_24320 [Deferrisomatales bacterium]